MERGTAVDLMVSAERRLAQEVEPYSICTDIKKAHPLRQELLGFISLRVLFLGFHFLSCHIIRHFLKQIKDRNF